MTTRGLLRLAVWLWAATAAYLLLGSFAAGTVVWLFALGLARNVGKRQGFMEAMAMLEFLHEEESVEDGIDSLPESHVEGQRTSAAEGLQ
jgi:hypothetical protein